MGNARVTQQTIEVLLLPDSANVRLTQATIEVLLNPTPEPNVRVTQLTIEALILPSTSTNPCADAWAFPEPNPFPFPLAGGPLYKMFEEMMPDWGEHGGAFPDGVTAWNTIQTSAVRRWQIDYDGLDQNEADLLDDHFYSTRGGISFSMTVPRTGEVLTGVRYESYKSNGHVKIWAQARSMILVKGT